MTVLKSCIYQIKNIKWVGLKLGAKYLISTILVSIFLFIITLGVDASFSAILKIISKLV